MTPLRNETDWLTDWLTDFVEQSSSWKANSHSARQEISRLLRNPATVWKMGVLGFDSRRGLGIFLFTTASRTALVPTQPPIQSVPGALSLGLRRARREADRSPPYSTEVIEWVELCLHTPITPSSRSAQLKYRDRFIIVLKMTFHSMELCVVGILPHHYATSQPTEPWLGSSNIRRRSEEYVQLLFETCFIVVYIERNTMNRMYIPVLLHVVLTSVSAMNEH
jgi:hypothetical protein